MRWRAPMLTDTRVRRRFAWWPVELGARHKPWDAPREMLWLERYEEHATLRLGGWDVTKRVALADRLGAG